MNILDIILIVGIIAIFFWAKKKTGKNTADKPENEVIKIYPYKKKMLLTKAEYTFYNTLKPLCDNANLIICPKVRMEDFLEITDKQNYRKYRGYVKSRHIDFLICDSKLHVIAGVELDDKTHNLEKTKQTDDFKNQVFKAIAIPLYRIKVSSGIYNDQITKMINEIAPSKEPSLIKKLAPVKEVAPTREAASVKEIAPAKEETPSKDVAPPKIKVTSSYMNLP